MPAPVTPAPLATLSLAALEPAGPAPAAGAPCAFCGAPVGAAGVLVADDAGAPRPACPLCTLPRCLGRPRIEAEVAIVWLPEMSGGALSALARAVAARIAAAGERHDGLDAPGGATPGFALDVPDLRAAWIARAAVLARGPEVERRLGTRSPRDLARALARLPPAAAARRAERLSGLRAFPLGRFHDGATGEDVFPDLAAAWVRESPTPPAPPPRPEAR